MFSGVLLLGALCACVVMWWRARVRESRAHPLPPALPDGLPIIGHLHKLIFTNLWDLVERMAKRSVELGGVTYCNFGPQIYYFISDPEDALTMANACLQKHFMYDFAKNWVGQGLITGSGAVWQRHRKMMNPMFSLSVIHGFLDVFNRQSKALLDTFEPNVGRGKVDISPHVKKITLETSCMTTFGEGNIKDAAFFSKYMKAVDKILHLAVRRFQEFWLQNETIFSLLGLRKQETELVKELKVLSDAVIHRQRPLVNGTNTETSLNDKTPDIKYQPLLDQLLEQSNKNYLTDQEIREELDTAIVAGYETTSNFLISALVLIGSHPEIQEKMYEEIMEVVGQDRDVEKEDLHKLVYTEAVIKESLRLIPVAPAVGRYIEKDVKLKNYTLRAGSHGVLVILGINRDPSWGADADQFRPERWLDAATLPQNSNAFAAFSLGKRSCIGRAYAMTSTKVVLAHVARKYRWTADHTKMKFKAHLTLEPVSGHEISLQRRH